MKETPRPAAPYVLFFSAAAAAVLLDYITKQFVFGNFPQHSSRVLLPGFLCISPTWNSGAAFGMMQWGGRLFLYLLPFMLAFLLFYTWRLRHEWPGNQACMGAVFGGALGNYLDRLQFGKVRDFIDVRFFDLYHFPVFNVADSAISCGVALMLLYAALKGRAKDPQRLESAQ